MASTKNDHIADRDADIDAARVLLHRATVVVRSATIGAAALDPPPDDVRGEHPPEIPAGHAAVLERLLATLHEHFFALAGTRPPDTFPERGGHPPLPVGGIGDPGPRAQLDSDIRRVEWAAQGLESILRTYTSRAPLAAALVRRVREELVEWAFTARAAAR